MASRLDRLVTLLETGSTQLIRNTAAQQLADIQKKHPHELFNLLTRVVPYLKAKSWDTRTAAAKAIGGIVENADKFDPNVDFGNATAKSPDTETVKLEAKVEPDQGASSDQLQLQTLDVEAILSQGKKLLGSAGKEYDYFLNAMEPAQRLAHQKKSLSSRLGLGGDYTEEELINDADLRSQRENSTGLPRLQTMVERSNSTLSNMDLMTPGGGDQTPMTPGGEDGGILSKRQINMLKRKNKAGLKNQASKVRVVDLASQRRSSQHDGKTAYAEPHAVKSEPSENGGNGAVDYFSLEKGEDDQTKVVSEFKGPLGPGKSELQPEDDEEGTEWPFERLCDYLMVDMFDHSWEVRHGAAMGLREVLRVHGAGAGRERGKTQAANDTANQHWLNDVACRLLCIFMLDRFGDYVSDNVVAPIRETAGQTLGSVLQYLSPDLVHACFRILHILVLQERVRPEDRAWQACHGGMIGMRYLVAVRSDLLLTDKSLMDGVLEVVMKGLADHDDDVRSVSAATLIPVSQEFVKLRPTALNSLIRIVWDCLSNLSDDLSASTGSVMDLLAKLCSYTEVLDVMKINAADNPEQSFAQLVPRLYPFLRHTITGVRSAALRALLTFVDIDGDGTKDWIDGKALRLIFQNILVERNEGVLKLSLQVWMQLLDKLSQEGSDKLVEEFTPHLHPLVTLTLHPIGVSRNPLPMEASLFIRPSGQVFMLPTYVAAKSPSRKNSTVPNSKKRRRESAKGEDLPAQPASAHNVDGPMITGDVDLVGADTMIRSKIYASQALGKLINLWPDASRSESFGPQLLTSLKSTYSSTQLTAAMIAEEFGKLAPSGNDLQAYLTTRLQSIIEDEAAGSYSDLVSYLRVVQAQCHALVNTFGQIGGVRASALPQVAPKVQGEEDASRFAFSIEDGERLTSTDYDKLFKMMSPTNRLMATQALNDTKSDALRAIEEAKAVKEQRDTRIKAAAAAAVISFNAVPKKVSTTIKGLMDSIKTEENPELQKRSAAGAVSLVQMMVASKKRVVVEKLVGNLVKFYCMDSSETPEFAYNAEFEAGILSLRKEEDIRDHENQLVFEREQKKVRIQRRGAKDALTQMSASFGADLFEKVPILQSIIESPLRAVFESEELPSNVSEPGNEIGQQAVDGMSTLRALVEHFDAALHPFILDMARFITKGLQCRLAVLRYSAAKCFATICSVITVEGFSTLVRQVLPAISNATDIYQRQGAVECVYHLIHVMEDRILPYVIFLIVPVLGRMSDSDNDVRLIATTAFATLVKLVPLEAGIPDPPGLPEDLLQGRERERKFMAQMLDPKKVEPYEIPVGIKATLRSYQQDGVNWLAFLNRYHLHGILCDDMGLGKTLQTLCMVASDHHHRAEEFAKTGNPEMRRLPSLIVCPPTLSGHWQQEIKTYAPFLCAVAYVGPPAQRNPLRNQLAGADIVITSYEICRNDLAVLEPFNWNYCVLDEGHLIKNPATKTTVAVKKLRSYHRLILSGTPIQNNVLELWSLFDFLMPGFLGTEKVFKDRFAKPIAASRFSKSSSKEQERGALAVEALHKQVLPFLLRRLKEEVLDDLPPKILQNYYCDMSDLQRKLMEDFTKTEGRALTELASSDGVNKETKAHIFTALNYMRKLCNSPALVMKPDHKAYEQTQQLLAKSKSSITDVQHAPKLLALRDLLVDCGIGAQDATGTGVSNGAGAAGQGQQVPTADSAVSPHRALVFCQMKEMLDLITTQVLKPLLPSATYLRLDGSVEASQRQDIVNKFNSDPSIDLLLLTTSVGGLGLNLTGADTVIFVEHDWNPQKDMQAMDRAHRIGQRRVVNVYRLVTRGTLEERILNLQRFKIDVASQVVQQQKAGLAGMDTGEILDLFNLDGAPAIEDLGDGGVEGKAGDDGAEAVDAATGEIKEKGKKGFLDDLGELWDERQYEEEYNLDEFLAKMKS